jgi:hypothetical protein
MPSVAKDRLKVDRMPLPTSTAAPDDPRFPPDTRVHCADCAHRRGYVCEAKNGSTYAHGLPHHCTQFAAKGGK